MTGWIKAEKDLANDPRVLRMASRLRHADVTLGSRSRLVVVGALVTLWWYADTHIREDDTLPIGADQIDELVGLAGFCDLMPSEWLEVVNADCVKLVDYLAHNGTTAKKRAIDQKRQERSRLRHAKHNADVTLPSRSSHADTVTRPRPRPRPIEEPPTPKGVDGEVWRRFESYRRSIGKPIKEASVVAAQAKLASFGGNQAAVVEQSIANSWQGLFALGRTAGNGMTPPAKTLRERLAKAVSDFPQYRTDFTVLGKLAGCSSTEAKATMEENVNG